MRSLISSKESADLIKAQCSRLFYHRLQPPQRIDFLHQILVKVSLPRYLRLIISPPTLANRE